LRISRSPDTEITPSPDRANMATSGDSGVSTIKDEGTIGVGVGIVKSDVKTEAGEASSKAESNIPATEAGLERVEVGIGPRVAVGRRVGLMVGDKTEEGVLEEAGTLVGLGDGVAGIFVGEGVGLGVGVGVGIGVGTGVGVGPTTEMVTGSVSPDLLPDEV